MTSSPAQDPNLTCSETTFTLRSGLVLAAKVWTCEGDDLSSTVSPTPTRPLVRVLALHGWIDNANTFDGLAPLLVRSGAVATLVALDFAGHGKSSHIRDGVYGELTHVRHVLEVLSLLQWPSCVLLGHSMGAAVALLVAAAQHPTPITHLIMLDSMGPWTRNSMDAVKYYQRHMAEYVNQVTPRRRVFANREDGAKRLLEVDPSLGQTAALTLMQRGMTKVGDGFIFSYDVRLRGTGDRRFAEDHLRALIETVPCPTLAVLATGEKRDWGTGPMPVEIFAGRVSHFKNFKGVEIPGGHHVHLNAADTVAPHILSFIQGQAKL